MMNDIFECIIIGSGPAAYTAALFLKSYKVLLFEGGNDLEIGSGGQLTTTIFVDNYPGFPNGITGPELMSHCRKQAIESNIPIISETVHNINVHNNLFVITSNTQKIITKTVIIATGASAKKLDVIGSKQYWNNGISACAVCDGFLFMNKICCVIGGGDTALEETIYLSNICKKVFLIHRRNEFRARNDKIDKARRISKVEFMTPFILKECKGNGKTLTSILIENVNNKNIVELEVDGLFFAIGHTPNIQLLKNKEEDKYIVDINKMGYIQSDKEGNTNIPGIFCCGDVQDYKYRQAVTAAASGYIVSQTCIKYLSNNK